MSRFHGLLRGGVYNNEGGGGGEPARESEGRRSWEACLSFISERRKAYCEGVERGRKGRDVGSKESRGSADTPHRTQRDSGHTKRQTYLPGFWQASKYPAASIYTPAHPACFPFPPSSSVSLLFFFLLFFYTHCLQVSAPQPRICPHISVLPALKGYFTQI